MPWLLDPFQGGGTFATNPDGSICVTVIEPQDCGKCSHPARVFINRNGRTLCTACDAFENPGVHECVNCGADRTGPTAEAHAETCPDAERQTSAAVAGRVNLPWRKQATELEAIAWGLKEWGRTSIVFSAACRTRNAGLLQSACNDLRRIVTRLDAYRRKMEREWSGGAAPQSKGKGERK